MGVGFMRATSATLAALIIAAAWAAMAAARGLDGLIERRRK